MVHISLSSGSTIWNYDAGSVCFGVHFFVPLTKNKIGNEIGICRVLRTSGLYKP
jgi:hypothetical protein